MPVTGSALEYVANIFVGLLIAFVCGAALITLVSLGRQWWKDHKTARDYKQVRKGRTE